MLRNTIVLDFRENNFVPRICKFLLMCSGKMGCMRPICVASNRFSDQAQAKLSRPAGTTRCRDIAARAASCRRQKCTMSAAAQRAILMSGLAMPSHLRLPR